MGFPLVGQGRIELPTYGLGNRRSVQLSYDPEMNADIISKSAADMADDFAGRPFVINDPKIRPSHGGSLYRDMKMH